DNEHVESLLRELGARASRDEPGCIELAPGTTRRYAFPVVVVSGVAAGESDRWLAGGFVTGQWGNTELVTALPVGSTLDDGRLRILESHGTAQRFELPGGGLLDASRVPGGPFGLDCAAWVDGAWWTVDPVLGTVSTSGATPIDWLPAGRWT